MVFKFHGGVKQIKEHQIEKFLLFFILPDKEIPFYFAKANGLITTTEAFTYDTTLNMVKILNVRKGFGCRYFRKTFIVKPSPESKNIIRISSISGESVGFFETWGVLLTKQEGYKILSDPVSKRCLLNEPVLPEALHNKMVHNYSQNNVRQIRIQK